MGWTFTRIVLLLQLPTRSPGHQWKKGEPKTVLPSWKLSSCYYYGVQAALLGLLVTKPLWFVSAQLLLITPPLSTPISDSVIQHCDTGCVKVQTSDYVAHDVCARKQYIKITPDTDGLYRITVLSGFPVGKAQQRRTTPLYDQEYVWGQDYYRVSVDVNNCLKVTRR